MSGVEAIIGGGRRARPRGRPDGERGRDRNIVITGEEMHCRSESGTLRGAHRYESGGASVTANGQGEDVRGWVTWLFMGGQVQGEVVPAERVRQDSGLAAGGVTDGNRLISATWAGGRVIHTRKNKTREGACISSW